MSLEVSLFFFDLIFATMTVGAGISVSNSDLVVFGHCVLRGVPENVVVTRALGNSLIDGAFIGVSSDQTGSHRVFPLGKIEYSSLSFSHLSGSIIFIELVDSKSQEIC